MMPTAARVLAPNAAVTAAGAASCSASQHFLNLQGSGVEVALAPSGFERRPDLRHTQPARVGGGRGATQNGQRVAVGQIVERLQRGGVVLAQRAAQAVGVAGARPDQILVRSGQHLDRLGVAAVAGDPAMVVPVGAHQISQQFGIRGIGLGSRDVVAVAVAGRRQRVDREHLISGCGQAIHPQAPVGFDTDHDLAGFLGVRSHQLVKHPHAGQAFG